MAVLACIIPQFGEHCHGPNMPGDLRQCNGGTVISGWSVCVRLSPSPDPEPLCFSLRAQCVLRSLYRAIGGTAVNFPAHVGLPMGPNDAKYALMEIHYGEHLSHFELSWPS